MPVYPGLIKFNSYSVAPLVRARVLKVIKAIMIVCPPIWDLSSMYEPENGAFKQNSIPFYVAISNSDKHTIIPLKYFKVLQIYFSRYLFF